MIATRVARKATLSVVSAVALTAVALLTSGCSDFTDAVHSDSIPTTGAAIQGIVHGGRQPIVGAHVYLVAAGSGGYGVGATSGTSGSASLLIAGHGSGNSLVASDSNGGYVTTDATGSFGITSDYTCPTSSTLVYLLASGGDSTGSGANTATMLAAPLGQCGSLNSSTFITVNEVTTAATAIALGQFIASPMIGTSPTNTTGLANAFATVNNLVNISTGVAVTSANLPNGCTSSSALCITTTPEATKLNTIANILAACVNTTGSGSSACTALFTATSATDTLGAAVHMSLHPTTSLAALYALQTGTSPYAGVGTQPTDWTVGIQYKDITTGTPTLLKPQNIAVDSTGNVWVLSQNGGLPGFAELSPTGTPLLSTPTTLDVLVVSSAVANTPPYTFTNTPFLFSATSSTPRNLAIDTANNVWFTTSSSATDSQTPAVKANGAIWEYKTSGTSTGFSTSKGAYGLAIDGNNNVFVGEQSSSAVFELFEFPGGDLTKPVGYPIATATAGLAGTSGSNSFIAPENLAIDTSGDLWMTGGVSGSNFAVYLANIASAATITGTSGCNGTYYSGTTGAVIGCALTTSTSSNTYNKIALGSVSGESGITVGASSIYIADSTTGNGVNYLASGTNTDIGSTASFTLPKSAATDGAGKVWVANYNITPTGSLPTPGGSVSELSSTGTILSPLTSSVTTLNPGYVHAGLSDATGIATDPSGNVWVANYVLTTGGVFEIVGAAAPTDTPIAKSLADGKVGLLP